MPNDYFHTGAGARYLRRAEGDLITERLRGNISVLFGSGANITVLSGEQGMFLVDAGISVSTTKVKAALDEINPGPLKYVVNTHWHWDHTDGNRWMHESGATVIAHRNTLKHLSQATHVDDWNWTFFPASAVARPTILVDDRKTVSFAGENIQIQHYGPGHTDGDLSVYFEQADVLALGDTFWNGHYPFIDNQDGGSVDDAIKWADKSVECTTDKTIVIPGHGPVATRTQLIEFRNMLVSVRDKVAALKRHGAFSKYTNLNEKDNFLRQPRNQLVGVVNTPEELQATVVELNKAGFGEDAIDVLCGTEGADRLDVTGEKHGLIARLYRFVEQAENLLEYEQNLLSGHFLIAIKAAQEDVRAQALTILKSHGGHRIRFYGTWTIEGLAS